MGKQPINNKNPHTVHFFRSPLVYMYNN